MDKISVDGKVLKAHTLYHAAYGIAGNIPPPRVLTETEK